MSDFMNSLQEILRFQIWNVSLNKYVILAGVGLFVWCLVALLKNSLIRYFRKAAKQSSSFYLDDWLVERIGRLQWPFYTVLAIFAAASLMRIQGEFMRVWGGLTAIVVIYYLADFLQNTLTYGLQKRFKIAQGHTEFDPSALNVLKRLIQIFVWALAGILILQNLNYDVSTLVTGLGIGGIAIAFALQNILADLFASVSIYLDKPFRTGDFVIIGTDMGAIEKIGLKSTRIRTLEGQILVVSNLELTTARINNYQHMEKRRVVTNFAVSSKTDAEQLRRVPKRIKEVVQSLEICEFDRAHFSSFSERGLEFELVYLIKSADYNTYMDIQQKINLEIKQILEEENVKLAFPTREILMR